MKNKLWFVFIIVIIAICIVFYFFTKNRTINNTNNNSNYTSDKTSTNTENPNKNNEISNVIKENKTDNNIQSSIINAETKKEELISSFSTKIYTKDSARQNNISITCRSLNDTVISNGNIFSFCNTVGKATSDKGYQKADIFDKDGNKEKGLGGGNCQVSTTLYNAVLKISSLVITERHEHSNKVPYIEEGKDAAVAYGSYDFKFKNNTGFDIKIKAENTSDAITINLYKIQYNYPPV